MQAVNQSINQLASDAASNKRPLLSGRLYVCVCPQVSCR